MHTSYKKQTEDLIVRVSFINFDEKHKIDYHFYICDKSIISSLYGWVKNPPNKYKIRVDKPHNSTGKKHIHIYKNGELVAINEDGTQHDHVGRL